MPPKDSIPLSPAANKNMDSCTDSIPPFTSSSNPPSPKRPEARFFPNMPDEVILMFCQELYDGGYGRSALSKLSRTCRRAHAVVLPILYKEIKAMPGCCCPISGRYEPRVPCSCSEEKRNSGFPRLNVQALVDSLLSNTDLASFVQTVDLHQRKKSATGQQMLDYGGNDCLLPLFFFLVPKAKFIKMPTCTSWQRGGTLLAKHPTLQAGLHRLLEEHDRRFPNIKNLHIGNGTRNLWDQMFTWSLISACANLEVLYLERARGSVETHLPPDPFSTEREGMITFVRHQIHLPNLVDLDIVHSDLSAHDFGSMTQRCTRLRRVSLVQFQSANILPVHASNMSPGPARILECLAASAATLEKLSISWAHKDFARASYSHPEAMVLMKPLRGFSALRLLELSYNELDKRSEGVDVLVNLIKDCDKLEALKLIGITNMSRKVLCHFARHVEEGAFPRLRMLKLCARMNDSAAWDRLKSIADDEIVSLLAAGRVKLVLRPCHRKPGDPRFPELNFEGDNRLVPSDSSSA